MQPLEAYRHAAERARRLLRLHDGLVNLRRYRIRKDWKESFCRLMHWPLKSKLDRVDTTDALIVLREGADLTPDDFTGEALSELLRSILVLGVSGWDRYVHQRVVDRIVAALSESNLSPKQEGFSMPVVLALRSAEAVRRAAKEGKQARPANEIRKRIQERIHAVPYQSWDQVRDALKLIGVTDLAGQVQVILGIHDIAPVKSQLNGIVNRRNRIVHEGDLVRHQRGGKARATEVGPKYVEESLDFLDNLVGALEKVG